MPAAGMLHHVSEKYDYYPNHYVHRLGNQ